MNILKKLTYIIIALLVLVSCGEVKSDSTDESTSENIAGTLEKKAILETLNAETKAAFSRDYEAWKERWLHHSDITKTYINFADSSFTEAVGWKEISQFVKEFMAKHPEPEPIPQPLKKIDVRLYGTGAWVTYEQVDALRGLKRETRLMEKENGVWKIAGMQTTIYGFVHRENAE